MAPSDENDQPPRRRLLQRIARLLPFSASTTPLQATTYLLGISLFSISFLVFLNSAVSFVITDLIGLKEGVGDIVGTLGFVDELVALIACPVWGLVSDRLGVRWVAVLGYAVIALALAVFVQARDVYPSLVLARILFALGATAAATMVTAILPVLTDDHATAAAASGAGAGESGGEAHRSARSNQRDSVAMSFESDATITPETFTRATSEDRASRDGAEGSGRKPSALAGLVGLFTGCGALVSLIFFLPLPAQFSKLAVVSLLVAVFVFIGLRGLKGEEGKGWRMLLGLRKKGSHGSEASGAKLHKPLPYHRLLLSSIRLGFTDPHIALGYLGGFVARASTVAISLFIPLYVNTFFIGNGFCQGSPHDPSPELKKECRAAYVLASILTGVAQFVALLCAPVFGYLSSRRWRGVNVPVTVATLCGVVGYSVFPRLQSPEFKDVDGRGGGGYVFLVAALLGISQIGAIVSSLGSLGRGVLKADMAKPHASQPQVEGTDENAPLLESSNGAALEEELGASRVQLKGSIAGVYSLCGGAAILLLTKLGGYLFDVTSTGAPFYMMAVFNAILLAATLAIDLGRGMRARSER
ncbi:U3 small nucleolar ribonucleoprotein Mpp10 [Apiospora arundinis]